MWVYQVHVCFPCLDCHEGEDGSMAYSGTQSTSMTGRTCLSWSLMQATPEGAYMNDTHFPDDGSVKAAKNYCRDPDSHGDGPWCFVRDGSSDVIERCDVCQDEGK